MAPEIRHLTPERFSDYIKENYTPRSEEVDALIEEAKKRQTKYVSAGSVLMSDVSFVVEREGVDRVPAMLKAIALLGSSVELSMETIARLLARGENTSSRLMLNKRDYKKAGFHARKEAILIEFLSNI